jgi:hydrogenase expression/formation protein HypE
LTEEALPVGKLPPPLLARLLAEAPSFDPRIILGPAPGVDCAVIDVGSTLLAIKSDPITFATDDIGWYLVQVNANDIATTGAVPRWMLLTLLLPEGSTTNESATDVFRSVYEACSELKVSVVGGHSEVTHGLDRPIAAGTLIGEVERDRLVIPGGAMPGDRVLLTKGVAIEATAIIAREFSDSLSDLMTPSELNEARDYLKSPGISVVADAQIAIDAGHVTAMHDPTEGGLWSALWELSEATGHSIVVNPEHVHVSLITAKICRAMTVDPYSAISSGALLLTASPEDSTPIIEALNGSGIHCADIGYVEDGPAVVWQVSEGTGDRVRGARPQRDEIARLFEAVS